MEQRAKAMVTEVARVSKERLNGLEMLQFYARNLVGKGAEYAQRVVSEKFDHLKREAEETLEAANAEMDIITQMYREESRRKQDAMLLFSEYDATVQEQQKSLETRLRPELQTLRERVQVGDAGAYERLQRTHQEMTELMAEKEQSERRIEEVYQFVLQADAKSESYQQSLSLLQSTKENAQGAYKSVVRESGKIQMYGMSGFNLVTLLQRLGGIFHRLEKLVLSQEEEARLGNRRKNLSNGTGRQHGIASNYEEMKRHVEEIRAKDLKPLFV